MSIEIVPDIPAGEFRLPFPLLPSPPPCVCCGDDSYKDNLCKGCYDSILELDFQI